MKKQSFKTVMVGVDLSDYSKIVANEAKKLASTLGTPLIFIFCFENFSSSLVEIPFDRAEVTSLYEKKIRKFYQIPEKARILIRFGHAADEILNLTKKFPSPLLVIGHKGGHPLARFFIGSVAEKILAQTTCPVWIHRGNKIILPRKILIPSDLTKTSEKTIQEVKNLERQFKSESEIFHVLAEPMPILDYQAWMTVYQAMKTIDDKKIAKFKKAHPQLQVARARGNVAASIEKRAKKFDLVAIAPRESSKSRLPFGGTSAKIFRTVEKPILVVP